ncbi:Gastricsin isoform X1 [Oopsacas minuta]|uniref:Gastricsin isoform X1 n=1 Tax=Oopsacas minuta TaxID=111878 RepID=A0AAV7K7Z9_9METZ|nr:Gastricsin isoform X1 [Oopsacas minuta]
MLLNCVIWISTGAVQTEDGYLIPNCDPNNLPDVPFKFAGTNELKIPPSIYIISKEGEYCTTGFIGQEGAGFDWLIGDLVHRAYYIGYFVGEKKVCFADSVLEKNSFYLNKILF